MKYIHVKSLEKYHPGYTERNLIWCKIHFSMISGDPDFEMLDELDQWRFVKLIMLELQSRKPIPLDEEYLSRKGFNFKKRSMSLTLQTLHEFIDVRNGLNELSVTEVPLCPDISSSLSISSSSLKESAIPKTVEDAIVYFKELQSDEKAAHVFFNYYSSIGWKVGKNSMKDWKCAARNWVSRDKEKTAVKTIPKRIPKPNSKCDACSGTGKLPDGIKCWCYS